MASRRASAAGEILLGGAGLVEQGAAVGGRVAIGRAWHGAGDAEVGGAQQVAAQRL